MKEQEEMCKVLHQHFACLFRWSNGLDCGKPLRPGGSQLAAREECFERLIMAVEVEEGLAECARDRTLGLEGVPYEFYCSIPDLFRHLLVYVFTNWQQNGRIPSSVSWGVVKMIRKDPSKWDHISNYRLVTLLNAELKILAKVLAKRLVCIVEKLVGTAQTCAIPGRLIQDNFHLHYTLDNMGKLFSKGGALIHLNQSKASDKVDH